RAAGGMKKSILWFIGIVAAFAGIIYGFDAYFLEEWVVPGSDPMLVASLAPTLGEGDMIRILKSSGAPLGHLGKCTNPRGTGDDIVGRVIAEAGDEVRIEGERPSVNNRSNTVLRTCNPQVVRNPITGKDMRLNCLWEEHSKGIRVLREAEF